MILPIIAYGDAILRKKAGMIESSYPNLIQLIDDLFETMHSANGVGLAAPQVGHSIRLFIIDTFPVLKMLNEEEKDHPFIGEEGMKKVIINATYLGKEGKLWSYNEGCLSIPKIREDIDRPASITLEYMDENFELHRDTFSGLAGRVVQHEYDHIEGVLFTDYLKPLKKRMIQKKLDNISKGKVEVDYKMRFPLKK